MSNQIIHLRAWKGRTSTPKCKGGSQFAVTRATTSTDRAKVTCQHCRGA